MVVDVPSSWGRYPDATPRSTRSPSWIQDVRLDRSHAPVLAYGLGRSYGDVCLNKDGEILRMEHCDHILAFDVEGGLIRAEAGLSIAELLKVIVPRGWFVPVTPGTKFVTLGGALANDVHGKNHHHAGTFGCHVTRFELLRSDGTLTTCSPRLQADLFSATIGGLGLTGVVTWIELRLIPIASRLLVEESLKATCLDEVVRLATESDTTWDYTVSWIDVLARGKALGRGHVLRGRFSDVPDGTIERPFKDPRIVVPFEAPNWLLSKPTISAFNIAWYHRQQRAKSTRHVDLESFFYPLDAVGRWNLLYGKQGMLQYQCVVPLVDGLDAIRDLIGIMQRGGASSFMAVVKTFGSVVSPGMMSFPRPGLTLTLDMPNSGPHLFEALDICDSIVLSAGGRVYPAKDARIRGTMFRAMYPELKQFIPHIDPAMSSSFWRRVMQDA